MLLKRLIFPVVLVFAAGLAAACGDDDAGDACNDDGICGSGETPQSCPGDCPICVEDGNCDTAAGETATNCVADCGGVQCDMTLTGDNYDYLVSQVFLPDTIEAAETVGVDLDGDGDVDNLLGAIVSMLAETSPTFDVNEDVNGAITRGENLILLRLRTNQFPDDEDVLVQVLKGSIHNDATPLFDGSDTVALHGDSAMDGFVCGLISGGELDAGPNNIRLPFPLPGMGSLMYNLQATQLVGTTTADGWTEVTLGGGVLPEDVDTVLYPALLVWMNAVIAADPTEEMAAGMISLLDGRCNPGVEGCENVVNGEGECDGTANPPVLTDTELRCNTTMYNALSPDVDLDGDGIPDVISVGLRIVSAVPVTIVGL